MLIAIHDGSTAHGCGKYAVLAFSVVRKLNIRGVANFASTVSALADYQNAQNGSLISRFLHMHHPDPTLAHK